MLPGIREIFSFPGTRGKQPGERVEDNQSINVVELDINTLTALMMGYKRPTYLYDHEKISMEYYMLTWLERLIPVKKPYFSVISKLHAQNPALQELPGSAHTQKAVQRLKTCTAFSVHPVIFVRALCAVFCTLLQTFHSFFAA